MFTLFQVRKWAIHFGEEFFFRLFWTKNQFWTQSDKQNYKKHIHFVEYVG